jgi:Na+-transporting methylmalonyl-CoA/oxaloacetate decarboxylase gamma subunit
MQLYSSYWVSLPSTVREQMREHFGIRRSVGTCVDGGRVICDGSTDVDLAVVTVEKMQELLKSKEQSFESLLATTIRYFSDALEREKVIKEAEEAERYEMVQEAEQKSLADVVEAVVSTVAKRRGGRPKGFVKNKLTGKYEQT